MFSSLVTKFTRMWTVFPFVQNASGNDGIQVYNNFIYSPLNFLQKEKIDDKYKKIFKKEKRRQDFNLTHHSHTLMLLSSDVVTNLLFWSTNVMVFTAPRCLKWDNDFCWIQIHIRGGWPKEFYNSFTTLANRSSKTSYELWLTCHILELSHSLWCPTVIRKIYKNFTQSHELMVNYVVPFHWARDFILSGCLHKSSTKYPFGDKHVHFTAINGQWTVAKETAINSFYRLWLYFSFAYINDI